jgi:acyl-CoA thioester hydrolase
MEEEVRCMLNRGSVPRSGRFVESRLRVRYKDTDQMGIAHHSNHIVWFEIGRTDLCREAGIDYRSIEDRGWIMVVADVACRYRLPFRYDDEVVIRTSIAEGGSRLMKFRYELYGATGSTLHAEGHSNHVWLDRETRRPRAIAEDIAGIFKPYYPGQ